MPTGIIIDEKPIPQSEPAIALLDETGSATNVVSALTDELVKSAEREKDLKRRGVLMSHAFHLELFNKITKRRLAKL
jgi:hypothetical protein